MAKFLEKIFGDTNAKELKKIQTIVDQINEREISVEKLTDEEIKNKISEIKVKLSSRDEGEDLLNSFLPEVFSLVREASKRTLGMRHFDVQLIGGIALHQGKIAEMKTGEGKTLVATLPLTLNALLGKGAHLVTPNDYLAKVGANLNGPLYEFLGLSVAVIGQQGASWQYDSSASGEEADWPHLLACSRHDAYLADITYGTNNEFGFDYLRDNMALSFDRVVQRSLNYAIVDEVDSILIDEARTPLIISAPAAQSADLYGKFAEFVKQLKDSEDYEVDEKDRHVKILESGIKKMEKVLSVDNIYSEKTVQYVHHLEEALKAKALYVRDKAYVVKDDEVIIVDEFTGRMMPGRRYSEGLHQAIEAKEGVEIRQESRTMATITFQNLFRMYDKLAGMTGTAATEAEEFAKIYQLDVVEIPTNRPVDRVDESDVIYKTEAAKLAAIVDEVKQRSQAGQPILIGTVSIEKSEQISKFFKKAGVDHDILNAKQHEREARIIEYAGEPGRVTIATNMAGRGVDIVLGGKKPSSEDNQDAFRDWENRHARVIEAGGLAVFGTERHESRRIDNQLRGRSGRQGDPGISRFYVSMEDDLMRVFGGERLKIMMDRLGLPDNEPIQHKLVSNSIEQAQKRVEGHNFDIRKHLVEYDDVMNQHREVVYRKRKAILELNPEKEAWLHEEIKDLLHEDELKDFEARVVKVGEENFKKIERLVYLRTIDALWVKHLSTMQHLREGIGLKGYAQKDPLIEYKDAAFDLFQRLKDDIENQVVEMLLKLEVKHQAPEQLRQEENLELHGADQRLAGGGFAQAENTPRDSAAVRVRETAGSAVAAEKVAQSITNSSASPNVSLTVRGPGGREVAESQPQTRSVNPYGKVGRNDLCPCGSGKKFKKCHGAS